jgi:hypothetical protein
VLDEDALAQIDAHAIERVDAAVEFAEASPFPTPESLYDDVYVLDPSSSGWYSVKTTNPRDAAPESPEFSQGSGDDEIPQQMSDAVARGEDAA